MAYQSGYQLLITGPVFRYVKTLRVSERGKLDGIFQQIVDHPFSGGDYQENDENGRVVEVVLKGQFLLAYWADHAVKEVRIVRVEKLTN